MKASPASTSANRLAQLQQMLLKTPDDPFLLYGIALEHKKSGDAARAIDFLDQTLRVDPGYCYAYYQRGQILESLGREDEARSTYRAGIDAATKKGDAHARGEIEAALDLLG